MIFQLYIGGLVAAGFDATGSFLLTVSHSGRGLFSTKTWERMARDYELSYPKHGVCEGIGPVAGQLISVTEMDFQKGAMELKSQDGRITLTCESNGIEVAVLEKT